MPGTFRNVASAVSAQLEDLKALCRNLHSRKNMKYNYYLPAVKFATLPRRKAFNTGSKHAS